MQHNLPDMNMTNVVPPVLSLCDAMAEMVLISQNESLIHSIVFDLFAGMIATGFVYKFYQGIEISHPIYSIIFTNIVFSTFISFVSFMCVIMNMVVVSCIPFLLALWINTNVFYINLISWMVITCLRYFLLVTAKNENEDINMSKIRMVALVSNWCTIIAVCMVRGLVLLLFIKNKIPETSMAGINCGLLFALLMIILVVYYKLDIELKKKFQKVNVQGQTELDESKDANEIFSIKSDEIENAANSNTFQLQRIEVMKKGSLNVCDSRVKNADSHPSNKSVFQKVFHKRNVINNRVETDNHATEDQDYGGIYIGPKRSTDTSGYNDGKKSSTIDKGSNETKDMKERNTQTLRVHKRQDSRTENITALLNVPLNSVNSNETLTNQAAATFDEEKGCSGDDLYVLPNQVCNEKSNVSAVVQVHVESYKPQTEHSSKNNTISKLGITHPNNNSDLREAPKHTQGTKSMGNDELDRISVIQESNDRVETDNQSRDNQQYGGINIDTKIRTDTSSYNDRQKSSTIDRGSYETNDMKRGKNQSVHINKNKDSRDKNITTILSEPLKSVNSNDTLINQAAATSDEEKDCSGDDLYVLPNQICNEKSNATAVVQVHVESYKSQTEQISKINTISEPGITDPNNDPVQRATPKHTQGTKSIRNDELDRISVIQESNPTSVIPPQSYQEQMDLHTRNNNSNTDDEEYKSSKEHKSIITAIITNCIYVGLAFLLVVVVRTMWPIRNGNTSLYFVIRTTYNLYRTFATILSSIYCFELVHCLFLQIVDNIKDYLQDLYNRIRAAF